jgi:hypothetical protein
VAIIFDPKFGELYNLVILESMKKSKFALQEGALDWFRQKINRYFGKSTNTNDPNLKPKLKAPDSIEIGSMFMYTYDAKTKDRMPYWDAFPLCIPIEIYSDGWLGINLHYIDPQKRIALLDKLLDFKNSKTLTNDTKLKLSYAFLKDVAKYKAFEPCLHRYLTTHVKSKLIYVEPMEWKSAIFLPVEQFRKATKQKVWKDSADRI